ncbi:hypothetical protein BC827DRAFT_1219430 [Russula dissimulans]|nr:hypothetical protein BC827DRAFT_1219430 [Russula dissimulans]
MLAHSPPLPLVLNYIDEDHAATMGDGQGPLHDNCRCIREVTGEDEEGILLALQHRDRVRCIRFLMPVTNLQKVAMAIDDTFPLLEYLYLEPLVKHDDSLFFMPRVPNTLQAPHLRHLVLKRLSFPIPILGSRLLTTAAGLVTLSLQYIHPSAHFPPDGLLQRLSVMPQLETLGITFYSTLINRHVETMQKSNTTPITLPNLRWFGFRGPNAYLETLLPRMITPLLDKLQISLFDRWTISSHLWKFMSATENLRFSATSLTFSAEDVRVMVYPHVKARTYSLYLEFGSTLLDRQVAFAVQIFNGLKTLYTMECLTLKSERPTSWSSSWWTRGTRIDSVWWRELLRSFGNVKTLRVPRGLVRDLSRFLKPDNGEALTELLPELEELFIVYSGSASAENGFTPFLDARQDAGRPVKVTHEIV